jgi:hypothetical protein
MIMKNKNVLVVIAYVLVCILCLAGCESLQKKFTRKKKMTGPKEEMVIVPRDYEANPLPSDVRYKQYFVYWKSWNQELVTAINDQAPFKKIVSCVEQAKTNLTKMVTLLKEEKAKELEVYLNQTEVLRLQIENAKTLPSSYMGNLRYTAERILSNVNRLFDMSKMREYLK